MSLYRELLGALAKLESEFGDEIHLLRAEVLKITDEASALAWIKSVVNVHRSVPDEPGAVPVATPEPDASPVAIDSGSVSGPVSASAETPVFVALDDKATSTDGIGG